MTTNIGSSIDKLYAVREKIREYESKIKELQETKSELEAQLLQCMDKEGVTKSTGKRASVSISENVKPSVEDWDEFYKFLHRNKAYYLLERRPSVSGCRELFEKRGKIPGVVPFVQRSVNLRTLK